MPTSDKYQTLKVLSRGTWGVVTQCRSNGGDVVALKMFEDATKNDLVCKVAVREAKVLKQLSHPNIIKLIEVYRTTASLFLVFEYVEFTLLDIIQGHRYGMPLDQVKDLGHQLLTALDYMHNLKLIHRDVKPENVLITKDGTLKLCDFGFARPVPKIEAGTLTAYVSTRWYRPPEMLLGDKYGGPADIWSVGCVLSEMVTGKPLLPGSSDLDQLHLVEAMTGLSAKQQAAARRLGPCVGSEGQAQEAEGEGSPLSKRLSRADPLLLDLISGCLQPDPSRRPTTSQLLKSGYFKGWTRNAGACLPGACTRAAAGAPSCDKVPDQSPPGPACTLRRPAEARHTLTSSSLHDCVPGSTSRAARTPAGTAVARPQLRIVTAVVQADRKPPQ